MTDAPILSPINKPDDIETATDFEKKHTPHIALSTDGDVTTITVTVGHAISHPNQPDHYIQWIEVQAFGNTIARFDLSPVATEPQVSVALKLAPSTRIQVIEHCNLHGLWASEAVI